MKKILTKLLLIAACGIAPAISNFQTFKKATAQDEFDGNAFLENIHQTYTVTDSMLTPDSLRFISDDDLFVYGTNPNHCVSSILDSTNGLYLADKEDFSSWTIFRIHRDEGWEKRYEDGDHDIKFMIEVLNPNYYEPAEYNPKYMAIGSNEDYDTSIELVADPNPYDNYTFFTIYYWYDSINVIASAGVEAQINYYPEFEDDGYCQGRVVSLKDLIDCNSENNMGFFKIIPAAKVTYDPNGAPEETAYTKLAKWHYSLDVCPFTYDKKCFIRWDTSPDGDGQPFYEGDEISWIEDDTLYAIWADNPIYEIEDISPEFSLAYTYTKSELSDVFEKVTSIDDIEGYDDLIIVFGYNGTNYCWNRNLEAEEVVIDDDKIALENNQTIEGMYFIANLVYGSVGLMNLDGAELYETYGGTWVFSESISNLFDIVTKNENTYVGYSSEELRKSFLLKNGDNGLEIVWDYVTNLGTEGYCDSCHLYRRKNNPYSDIDFRVRISLNVYDYINDVEHFIAPTFDSEKFTDYGFDLYMKTPEGWTTKTLNYSFVENKTTLVYSDTDKGTQYINLKLGDCLSKPNRYKLDYQLEVIPYVVYDEMKIKSQHVVSYSLRELISRYYNDPETKESFVYLYNIVRSFPEPVVGVND